MDESGKAYRARNLRYKRAALASMGFDHIFDELGEIQEACENIHYWVDQDDETLLNALDGDEEDVWEFKMAFSDLEARADQLYTVIHDACRDACWGKDDFSRIYDDCTVALIGNQYRTVGFDSFEEDYYSLCGYDEKLAQTESGKRLMRRTKADIISTVGQCFGILISFLDLRQQYDYLKAMFDILRDDNTAMLQQIKEIETAYREMDAADWVKRPELERKFDRMLAALPDRAWIE